MSVALSVVVSVDTQVFYERLERSVFFMLGFTFLVVFDKGVYGSFGEMMFVAVSSAAPLPHSATTSAYSC